jgi:hypothetical protein
MGFLDNSGDIILDAVLTDTGRKRLAQGDGSFKIVKFALGDDEIDYTLYDNANPNGSAYYDLNILQSPVLEAFTNNMSSMKSKLMTVDNEELLYLPVVKLNDIILPVVDTPLAAFTDIPVGGYLVTADYATSTTANAAAGGYWTAGSALTDPGSSFGIIRGREPFGAQKTPIVFDQGLNSNDLTVSKMTAGDTLRETQYLVEMDHRFGRIVTPEDQNTLARPSYIDDDNVAGYYFTLNRYPGYFAQPDSQNGLPQVPSYSVGNPNNPNPGLQARSVIGENGSTGVYGTRFGFFIRASDELASSNTLFTKLGGTTASNYIGSGQQFYYIDTTIRVTGYYTGYSVDVPIRFIKKV